MNQRRTIPVHSHREMSLPEHLQNACQEESFLNPVEDSTGIDRQGTLCLIALFLHLSLGNATTPIRWSVFDHNSDVCPVSIELRPRLGPVPRTLDGTLQHLFGDGMIAEGDLDESVVDFCDHCLTGIRLPEYHPLTEEAEELALCHIDRRAQTAGNCQKSDHPEDLHSRPLNRSPFQKSDSTSDMVATGDGCPPRWDTTRSRRSKQALLFVPVGMILEGPGESE